MKVYVVTKARPFHDEAYLFVEGSLKKAEKRLRKFDPFIKKAPNYTGSHYFSENGGKGEIRNLYWIREEDVYE